MQTMLPKPAPLGPAEFQGTSMLATMRTVLACLLFAGLVVSATPHAMAIDDPFAPENAIGAKPQPAAKPAPLNDPFGPANAVDKGKPQPAAGKIEVKPIGKIPPTAERIDFAFDVKPVPARRGEVVTLTIGVKPRPGFYTYPATQRAAQNESQSITELTFAKSSAFQPIWPTQEPPAEFYDTHVPGVGTVLRFTQPFTWTQAILVLPDAPTGPQVLKLSINIQVCDKKSCLPGEHTYDITIPVSDATPVPVTDAIQARLKAKQQIREVPVPDAVTAKAPSTKSDSSKPAVAQANGSPSTPSPTNPADQSIWGVLLASIGSAFLMLLTPCVFPMIPITVSFFVKQSEKEHHRPFRMAGIYSLTIIIVLTAAVLILGKFVIDLANNPWMNLGLGVVLIFFALSLFGMYDIELPSFLARYTSAHESKGGLLGTFFMALTFTITSFTCTGPFLGPLLASFGAMQVSYTHLVIAALAYSATFAAPFFLLALFPGLLKTLPKSGGWLNSVKVVMGFLELAAALKFLGNTDAVLNPGNPWLFNYDTVLCAWIVLSGACGLYLLGIFRLPHDEPQEHIGVGRMVLATIFLGMSLYLIPALWRNMPLGVIGEKLIAFLPQDSRQPAPGGNGAKAELDWHRDYEQAWAQAVKENKLIFIDFTGVQCTNCRDNEYRVFPRPEVRRELEKYVRVQMYNDSVPTKGLSREEAHQQALRNRELQDATFGDISTPLYVVFKPGKDGPFTKDGRLNGVTLEKVAGLIPDTAIGQFVTKLQAPLNTATAQGPVDRQVARRESPNEGP